MSEPTVVVSEQVRKAMAGRIDAINPDDDMVQHLVCAVCHHPSYSWVAQTASIDAVTVVCCGQIFHRDCVDDALRRCAQCPVCREAHPRSKLQPASRRERGMLGTIKVKCPQGCGSNVAFEKLHHHVYQPEGCEMTTLRCNNKGCVATFLRRYAAQHHGECAHLIVPCGICEVKVPRGQRQEHQRTVCPMAEVSCEFCKADGIRRSQMEAHRAEACTGCVPMCVMMQTLKEFKLEAARAQERLLQDAMRTQGALLRQVNALQSAQHCLLAKAGFKTCVVELPDVLGSLLHGDAARYELRTDRGIEGPIVLSRKEDQVYVVQLPPRHGAQQRLYLSLGAHCIELQGRSEALCLLQDIADVYQVRVTLLPE